MNNSSSTKKIVKKKPLDKKPRARNPEQTRAKLLQATIDLLSEKGPDALSLKEAARVANVSRSVAYQHFEDRDHLLREAKTWMADRLLESAKNVEPMPKVQDVHRAMDERVNAVAQLVLSNREAARLLITDALAGKALDVEHPLYKMVVADLEALKASGNIRNDADIEVLTFIMLSTVATIVMVSHLPHAGDTNTLAQRFTVEWTRLLREGMIDKTPAKQRTPPSSKPQRSPAKAQAKTKSRPKP